MRSGHGGTAGSGICGIAGVASGAGVSARSSDIRFRTVTAIPDNRPAAAKASYGIRPGIQGSNCVRGFVEGRRIRHSGTGRARVTGRYHHLDTSGFLSFNSGLQLVTDDATFRCRAAPGVNRNIRCLAGIAFVRCAVQRIWRKEKLHALDVPGRRAVSLVHVTTRDPLRPGRHSNLVSSAVIANRGPSGMTAVEKIVTRLR
jgi:hypothetical protein